MVRSFDGIALRQLRTRTLRSALTALGVVLGVGMVFGVLVLVGTIRSTFTDLIDAAYGSTDLVIAPRTRRPAARRHARASRARRRACSARARWSAPASSASTATADRCTAPPA